MNPTDPLQQSPLVRWSSTHRCLPFPMPSITLSAPGSMSCPSHRKKSPWQLQKSRNDRRKNFSVSCGEGTCYFSGGRRRKNHTDVQSGCALRPQGLAGIGRYHHPYYAAAPAWSGHRRMQSFSACGSAAVMPWPEPLHPGGKLTAPPQAQLERWMTLADIVLIEADGAKRMPCKAPAAHEPVLLPQCDTVLAVAGLSALRHPLRGGLFPGRACRRAALCSAGCAVDTGTSGKAACE